MAQYAGQHGRKAFGPKRHSLATQAKFIAESIQANPGRDLSHYGVEETSEVGQLVKAILSR